MKSALITQAAVAMLMLVGQGNTDLDTALLNCQD